MDVPSDSDRDGRGATDDGRPAPRWLVRPLRAVGRTLVAQSRALRIVLAASWAAWIWFLSANQLPSVAEVPFAGVLSNFAHGPVFGLLGLFAIAALSPPPEPGPAGAWPPLRRAHLVGGVLLVLAYACVDEVHQSFTPGRSPSLGDVTTDVLGAWAVAATIHRLDPRGADGRGLLRLWMLALVLIFVSAVFGDVLGFFGIQGTPAG